MFIPPPPECRLQKERILLFVGRLNFVQKRPDLLLEIWARLEKDFPDWRLEICGDGPDAGAVKSLAEKLNLQRVNFRGFVDPLPFMKAAPILCMTSSTEGFPMVMCEASSQGCVPAAFDSFAPAREIITDGENGFLVKPFDLDAYAGTLRRLMTDEALRERSSANALKNAARFSVEKITDEWLALFDSYLKQQG